MAQIAIDRGVRELRGKPNWGSSGDWSENDKPFPAVNRLIAELDKGKQSGEQEGWLSIEAVEASLDV
jgi:hypothetical protein